MLTESLHKAGYRITLSVTNGAEAWDMLTNLKDAKGNLSQSVSLIITDIEMPQMDGMHLTKRIKDDPVLRKLPVVIFSSIIDDQMRLKCEQVGADAQLSKPEIGRLISVVDRLTLR
jgi:two-component system chemotaxis response regulator CheV